MSTAEELAADQATVDVAEINVQIAQQNLAAAMLTSTLTGTVAAVSITAGSSVSGNSTTAVVTILPPGSYLVSATGPLSVIDKIEVGQDTQVRPDVLSQTLDGTVETSHGLGGQRRSLNGRSIPGSPGDDVTKAEDVHGCKLAGRWSRTGTCGARVGGADRSCGGSGGSW